MKSQLFGTLSVLGCAVAIFALVRNRQTTPFDLNSVDLNSGMTAAIANPPAGFVSTRKFPPTDVPARIAAIRWFEHCGEPFQGQLSMPFEQVGSWAEAEQRSAEEAWETATLEAQNQLTLWLHLHAHQRYQDWNRHVKTHNATTIEPVVQRSIEPFRQTHNLSKEFIGCTTWDLLGALMEDTYRDTGHAVFFFHELIEVYEAGHYPCGWVGQWPEGKLLIY